MNLWGDNPLKFNNIQQYGHFNVNGNLSNNKKHEFNLFVSANNLTVSNSLRFIKWEVTGGYQYRVNAGSTLFVG